MKYLLILSIAAFAACQSTQSTVSPGKEPVEVSAGFKCEDMTASWEMKINDGQVKQEAQPQRHAWTKKMCATLRKHYDVLISAKDVDTIIPKRQELTKEHHLAVFTELMSTVAEYEISWKAAGTAKDVNGRSEPEYRATGLFQLNVGDQKTYKTGTSFTAEELKNPLNNIEAGVGILVTVIKVRGKITFNAGEKSPVLRYFFATLLNDTAYGMKTLKPARARIATLVAGWGY